MQGWGGRVIGGGTADGGPDSTGAEVLGIPGGARVLHQLQKAGGGAWAGPGRQPGEEAEPEPERTPALPTAVVVVSRSWGSGEEVSRGVPRRLEDWKTPEKTR